jgi:hypothetical protein
LFLRDDLHALFDRWLITIDPSTWSIQIAPELKRYPGLAELGGRTIQLPMTCCHGSDTYKSMRRSLARPGDNWLDKLRHPHC